MTLAVFSTSLQEAGDLLSDLLLQLRISWEQSVAQQHQKKSHMSCLKDLCARLQGCVNKMCVRGGLQRWFFPNCMAQNIQAALAGIWFASFISVSSILQQWFQVSHLSNGDIFPVSCTNDGNMDALRCWWSCFDFHLPQHLGPVPSSRVQVHVSRLICRKSPGYVPVFIQKSSVSQVYIRFL